MTKGLRLTGLKRVDLDSVPKNDPRKVLIALAIKQETGMSLKWIADKLRMGVTTGLSRYASEARREAQSITRKAKLYKEIVK